jgi:hypothetical protein
MTETFTKNRRLSIPQVKKYKYLKTTEETVTPNIRGKAGHLDSIMY